MAIQKHNLFSFEYLFSEPGWGVIGPDAYSSIFTKKAPLYGAFFVNGPGYSLVELPVLDEESPLAPTSDPIDPEALPPEEVEVDGR